VDLRHTNTFLAHSFLIAANACNTKNEMGKKVKVGTEVFLKGKGNLGKLGKVKAKEPGAYVWLVEWYDGTSSIQKSQQLKVYDKSIAQGISIAHLNPEQGVIHVDHHNVKSNAN
jgi:hypothetical protein